MALIAYLRLKGQKSGDIKGSVVQKGREGRIAVIACSHSIVSPRDPASGLPTGKRQHEPLVITKEIDQASPILHQVQGSNETITEFALDFYSVNRTGIETNTYSIALVNAGIAGFRTVMPNVRDPALMKLETYEEIGFTYQKITWTWNDPGVSAQDDWGERL